MPVRFSSLYKVGCCIWHHRYQLGNIFKWHWAPRGSSATADPLVFLIKWIIGQRTDEQMDQWCNAIALLGGTPNKFSAFVSSSLIRRGSCPSEVAVPTVIIVLKLLCYEFDDKPLPVRFFRGARSNPEPRVTRAFKRTVAVSWKWTVACPEGLVTICRCIGS